jgi:hypothetical protein
MNDSLFDAVSRCCGAMSLVMLQAGRALLAIRRAPEGVQNYGCNNIRHFAMARMGLGAHRARRLVEVAEKLESLPELTRALESGELSWDQVAELVQHATPETDGEFVRLGKECCLDRIRSIVQDLANAKNPKLPDVTLSMTLEVDTALMWERASVKLSEEAGRPLNEDEKLQRVSALVVVGGSDEKSVKTLRDKIHLDRLAAQASVARNLARLSDMPALGAEVKVMLERIGPVPDTFNKKLRWNALRRLLSEAQKEEIRRRDDHCCATPGCQHRLYLEAHHVTWWFEGGATVRENIVLLCSACHALIHEGYLVLTGCAPHGLIFRDRHGQNLELFAPFVRDPDLIDELLEQEDGEPTDKVLVATSL